jgi:predicted Fe-Mo cluster-binding NifX family protein
MTRFAAAEWGVSIEEDQIMKIAVTSRGADLGSEVDPRFGRAAYILFVDSETLEMEVLDNRENVNAFKGAGIQAASMVSDKGAEVLLTGFCGPNAFRTLKAAKIKVANDVSGTVRDAVKAFNEGKVSFADTANVEGHWV